MLFTAGEAARVIGGTILRGSESAAISGVAFDSRTAGPGDLFIAIPGERVDGHRFVPEVLAKGAAGALIARRDEGWEIPPQAVLIQVPDTVRALGALAEHHRSKFNIPVVGVTGSVGKTTTKDLTASVLSRRFNTLKSMGNFNTEVGVPMTVFQLSQEHGAAVFEMGMRGLGQIADLAEITRPNVGIVTNVGMTHLEVLGSQENIARAKGELIRALPAGGWAVLNGADPSCRAMAGETRAGVLFYGLGEAPSGSSAGAPPAEHLDIVARDVTSLSEEGVGFTLVTPRGEITVRLPVPGLHNVSNALAAAGAGLALGLSLEEIRGGLAEFTPTEKRMQIETVGGVKILNDTYNASPASTVAALRVLKEVARGRQIAVLGNMLELGEYSSAGHQEVGGDAAGLRVDFLVAVGDLAAEIAEGAQRTGLDGTRIRHCADNAAAVEILAELLEPGDTVLVKGSRGVKMEEIVHALERRLEP